MEDYDTLLTKLQAGIYDPNITQINSLQLLQDHMDGNGNIPDATNPFMFLLENNAMVTAAAMKEISVSMRINYPILATTKSDLYGHINNSEIDNIFSVPSSTTFNMYLGLTEILKYGNNSNPSLTTVILPQYSNIVVDNITFTLLNDIQIYVYSNGNVFAKYNFNTNDIGLNTDTILVSNLVKDIDGKDWLMIEVDVTQIKRYSFRETLMSSIPFKTDVVIDDSEFYTFLTCSSINNQNNEFTKLDVSYSDYIYNPNVATILVRPNNNVINLEVPSTYTVNELISSYLDIELFTTLGNKTIPLNKYDTLDFIFNVVIPNTTDESIIGINNIPIKINSNNFTFGGRDELDFLSLKNKIINYATGDNDIPITIHEVKDRIENLGMTYKKVNKTLLKNDILVTKDIGNLDHSIYANINTIQADILITPSSVVSDKIIIKDNNKMVIEPYQLFKRDGSNLIPLSNSERDVIKDISTSDINEYNKYNIFFNLYKYILDYNDLIDIRVYDVNQPSVSEYTSIRTTNTIFTSFVVTDRTIINIGTGYELLVRIEPNSELDKLDYDKVHSQCYITLDNNDRIYFKGDVIRTDTDIIMSLILDTDSYITDKNQLLASTSVGTLFKAYVNLLSEMSMIIYSTDTTLLDNNSQLNSSVIIDNSTFILYEETFKVEFGKHLENIYSSYNVTYTDRKFKTYTEDVYKLYETDIYETDETGTIIITPIDTDEDGVNDDISVNKLFSIGDYMLDSNGDKIVLHYKGDIILDEFFKPTVDAIVGINHNINMLLLEDKFLRTTNDVYKNYRIDYFIYLTNLIANELKPINDQLLDNTTLKYIADIGIDKVDLLINNKIITYDNLITPTISIYIGTNTTLEITSDIEKTLYYYLQEMLFTNTTIGIIENGLKELLEGEILSVKLSGLDTNNTITILNYSEDSSKFIINKTLSFLEDMTLIVKPDLKINILTI